MPTWCVVQSISTREGIPLRSEWAKWMEAQKDAKKRAIKAWELKVAHWQKLRNPEKKDTPMPMCEDEWPPGVTPLEMALACLLNTTHANAQRLLNAYEMQHRRHTKVMKQFKELFDPPTGSLAYYIKYGYVGERFGTMGITYSIGISTRDLPPTRYGQILHHQSDRVV